MVVPIANGEPVALIDELEAQADRLDGVKIHQMHALRDRPYLRGRYRGHLEHVAWFLSPVTREAYASGGCQFAPANFSEVPQLLLERAPAVVLAAASPPDDLGYFSLGVSSDYTTALIGRVPFVLEVNEAMPHTFGTNRLHRSEVLAWCETATPLIEEHPPAIDDDDRTIAELVADRIPNGATIQLGIGAIPSAVATLLEGHRHLGVHFCDRNDTVVFLAVDEVNDPRRIGREPRFISINATLEVDLYGQCASETLGTRYWSGSGGQADFARGSQYSEEGDGFVVLPATAKDGTISRIVPRLQSGAVVTTLKNTVDNVVTEYGVAELRGRTLDERAEALIGIAAPAHRERLRREARSVGLIRP